MATPKGMSCRTFQLHQNDAVHLYSDDTRIILQLRREVPTEKDVSKPSFKTALNLPPATAKELAVALLEIAAKNKAKQDAKAAAGKKENPTMRG